MKTREIFNFIPLLNNSVTVGLSFLLLSISAVISSNAINIFHVLFGLYSSIFFIKIIHIIEYSIKAFKSLKYFNPVLSLLLISN